MYSTSSIFRLSFLLLLCSQFCYSDPDKSDQVIYSKQLSIAHDLLDYGGQLLKQNLHHYSQMIQNDLDPNSIETFDDQECLSLLNMTLANPFGQEWSARLIDSTGSLFGTGLLTGTYSKFGDFDSCLDIQSNYTATNNNFSPSSELTFVGQYCWATIRLPKHLSELSQDHHHYNSMKNIGNDNKNNSISHETWKNNLIERWIEINVRYPIANGICVPSVCRPKFLKKIFLNVFKPLNKTTFDVDFCQNKSQNSFADWFKAKLIVSIILGSILTLTIIGTIVDIIDKSFSSFSHSKFIKTILCFSLISNVRSLTSTKNRSEYPWIDGWRIYLTVMVLLSHVSISQGVLELGLLSPFAHFPDDYQKLTRKLVNRYIINSTYTIKSFFMMSGFLLSRNLMKRKQLPNFLSYILNRWLRFTPSLIGYIALTFVLGFVGNGPLFHERLIEPYLKPCYNNLLAHFLYYNNWQDFRQMCGFQTWYISADFQLYILAFGILWLYHKHFSNLANALSLSLIILAYMATMAIFVFKIHGIPYFISVLYPKLPFADRGFLLYWTATYNHLEAYFLGIIIGTLVDKKIPYNLSKPLIKILLILCQSMLLVLPHFFPLFLKDLSQRSIEELIQSYSWFDAVVLTFTNLLWLISISLMFYLSATYTSIVRKNLLLKTMSASCLIPFARISFTSYLVHTPLTWFVVHQQRFPLVKNDLGAFSLLMLFYTAIVALVLHLLFELPFAKLFAMLFRPSKFSRDSNNNNNNNLVNAQFEISNSKI